MSNIVNTEHEVILADGTKTIDFVIPPEVLYKSLCENEQVPLRYGSEVIGSVSQFRVVGEKIIGVAVIDEDQEGLKESLVQARKSTCSLSINGYFVVGEAQMEPVITDKVVDITYESVEEK